MRNKNNNSRWMRALEADDSRSPTRGGRAASTAPAPACLRCLQLYSRTPALYCAVLCGAPNAADLAWRPLFCKRHQRMHRRNDLHRNRKDLNSRLSRLYYHPPSAGQGQPKSLDHFVYAATIMNSTNPQAPLEEHAPCS